MCEEFSRPRQCELALRVRYAETDPMGALHHSRYFVYFEMGRTELLRLAGFRYRDLEERGVLFVVFKAACQYKCPARYDDEVRLVITAATAMLHGHIHSDRDVDEYVERYAKQLLESEAALGGDDGAP